MQLMGGAVSENEQGQDAPETPPERKKGPIYIIPYDEALQMRNRRFSEPTERELWALRMLEAGQAFWSAHFKTGELGEMLRDGRAEWYSIYGPPHPSQEKE